MKEFYAHINEDKETQTIPDHLNASAELASLRVGGCGISNTARLAALLHDIGKYSDEFQDYISRLADGIPVERGSVNHTFAAVIWMLEEYHGRDNDNLSMFASEIISYACGSHHGLFDCLRKNRLNGYKDGPIVENGFKYRLDKKEQLPYGEVVERFLGDFNKTYIDSLFCNSCDEIETFYKNLKEKSGKYSSVASKNTYISYNIGMMARMMSSAVMYGDRSDTASFYGARQVVRSREGYWKEQADYFEEKLAEMTGTCGDPQNVSGINAIRRKISESCKSFWKNGKGIYRLSVPTGAGKTLSTIRYAYHMAANTPGIKRVIFAIPLLSVLEQNAEEIRKYTKDAHIGEHHSDAAKDGGHRSEILSDFWEEPVIITTMFQLLMTMFSGSTRFVTRFSSLANAVIVMDEVQSIPLRMTNMFNLAVNFLHTYFGTTFVLCSATQPEFAGTDFPIEFSQNPDIVKLDEKELEEFKRTNIMNMTGFVENEMSHQEAAGKILEDMEKSKSLLCICNTKSDAAGIYKELTCGSSGYDICHLSTSMCQAHRKDILKKHREALDKVIHSQENEDTKKVICISTSLMEAGVDLSYQTVYRCLAGLPSLVQAAGRNNRSREYPEGSSTFKIIKLKNENYRLTFLPDMTEACNSTVCCINELNNSGQGMNRLFDENMIRKFYEQLYFETNQELNYNESIDGENVTLLDLMSNNVHSAGCFIPGNNRPWRSVMQQALGTAGDLFRVYDDNQTDVIVPYKEGKEIIRKLKELPEDGEWRTKKELLKAASPYTVKIYNTSLEKMQEKEAVVDKKFFFYVRDEYYNEDMGVAW